MSVDGLLVVDKPRGPTSHDVVAAARRLFGTRSVGHAGTLDPMASGVLVLLVGQATKLSGYVTLDEKEYRATVEFGRSTDTLDSEGRTLEERATSIDEAALHAALDGERERAAQVPPAFSAISIDGDRAHRRSRRGETVVLPPRPVGVRSLSIVSWDGRRATCDLAVSKGYYVRAFARDLGDALGVPAHLSALERRASGPYRLEEAVQWPAVVAPALMPLEDVARRTFGCARLTDVGAGRAACGKELTAEDFVGPPPGAEVAAWLDGAGALLALGKLGPGGSFRVVRGFSRSASTQ